ncbi:MAG: hypothetical protein P8Y45_18930 [Exilibacterium sp.]
MNKTMATMKKHYRILSLFIAVLSGEAVCAWAHELPPQDENPVAQKTGVVYGSEWFIRFAPSSAADMVQLIPSFKHQATDDGRGIGQTAENVLINGKPVKGKGASAFSVLQKLPASAVLNIEVKDSAYYNLSGISGLVANVNIKRKKMQGTWKWSPEYRREIRGRTTNGSLSLSGELEDTAYSIGISNDSSRKGTKGRERILDQLGREIEHRKELYLRREEVPVLAVDVAKQVWPSVELGISSNIKWSRFDKDFRSRQVPTEGITRIQQDEFSGDSTFSDATLRLEKDEPSKKAHLLAFISHEEKDTENYSVVRSEGGAEILVQNAFNQQSEQNEYVIRGDYQVGNQSSFWAVSGELAYNRLEASSENGENQSGMALELSLVSGATGSIEENRAEGFLTRRFSYGDWVVDASLGVEYSQLNVSALGEVRDAVSRSFTRPKGHLSGVYPVSNDSTLRLGLERKVDQLDFFNFLGAADFRLGRSTGSNVNLVPSQRWELVAEAEKRFGNNSSVKSSIKYIAHEDIVGHRLIGSQDVVGNIGSGYQKILESELAWRPKNKWLERWQWNISIALEGSELTDPITLEKREFSEGRKWYYRSELSYEFADRPLAVGFGAEQSRNHEGFLSNEIFRQQSQQPFTFIYLKHRDFFGLNVAVYAFNLLDSETAYDRNRYEGIRNDSALIRVEQLRDTYGPFLTLDIQATF